MEVANSAAYFLGDYRIVKNNIPLGDNKWCMFDLKNDPVETKDIAALFPNKIEEMMQACSQYTKAVGVIEMQEGYSAEGEVGRKSVIKVLNSNAVYILGVLVLIVGLIWFWISKRNPIKN